MNEVNFILNRSINYNNISATQTIGENALSGKYDELINRSMLLYPAANADPTLNAELIRGLNVARASNCFNTFNICNINLIRYN